MHSESLLGRRQPLHYHLNQEEWSYATEGAVGFKSVDNARTSGTGESVLAPTQS
jgi:hypothetical protein